MIPVPAALDHGEATPEERRALFASLAIVLGAMRAAGMLPASVRLTPEPPEPFGLGAKGPMVGVWQMILGGQVKVDKDFGPKTLAATRAWSKKLGFGDSQVVTPAMWATAVGVTLRFGADAVILPDGQVIGLEDAAAASKTLEV